MRVRAADSSAGAAAARRSGSEQLRPKRPVSAAAANGAGAALGGSPADIGRILLGFGRALLRLLRTATRSHSVVFAVAAACIAVPGAWVSSFDKQGMRTGTDADLVGSMLRWWAIAFLALVAAALVLGFVRPRVRRIEASLPTPVRRILFSWNIPSVAVCALVIVWAWTPWIQVMNPPSISWDTFYQLYQWLPWAHPLQINNVKLTGYLTDHHPVFDSVLFADFGYGSLLLTGSANPGLRLLDLIQVGVMATGLGASVCYVRRCHGTLLLCALLLAFFAGYMPLAAYATTLIKDTLYSGLYIWFLGACEAVRSQGRAFRNPWFLSGAVALCALLCLTKKTGFYVVLASVVVLAFCMRGWRARAVMAGLAASCLFVQCMFLPQFVLPMLDAQAGETSETYGTLVQQTARTVKLHGGDVGDEERAAIDRVLGYDTLAQRYTPWLTDPVKDGMTALKPTDEDYERYRAVWLDQLKRYPDTYIEATLCTCGGYFAPTSALWVRSDIAFDRTWIPLIGISQPLRLEPQRQALAKQADYLTKDPSERTKYNAWWFTWVAPLGALVCVTMAGKRRRRVRFLIVPTAISVAFLVVSPCFDPRYCLPLVLTTPTLLCLALLAVPPRSPWRKTLARAKGSGMRADEVVREALSRRAETGSAARRHAKGSDRMAVTPRRAARASPRDRVARTMSP